MRMCAPRVIAPAAAAVESAPPAPAAIDDAVARIAAQHSLTAELLHAVIKVESNYNSARRFQSRARWG